MAADDVERQRRAGIVHVADLAVGHEPQLDERLEAVAHAADQAVPRLEQRHGLFGQHGIAQEGRDELARAVRFVAAGEAARQEEDLALVQQL